MILAAEFNPFRPEIGLAFWTVLVFVALFFFLAKKVYPKLEATLADREARVRESFSKAEEQRLEAERSFQEYKDKISQARDEASRVIEDARQTAEGLRREVIERAESDARTIVTKAQEELQAERDRVITDLQTRLAEWSVSIAGKIIERELSEDAHRDLIDRYVREIAATREPGS